jgi:hypothetical protein
MVNMSVQGTTQTNFNASTLEMLRRAGEKRERREKWVAGSSLKFPLNRLFLTPAVSLFLPHFSRAFISRENFPPLNPLQSIINTYSISK